MSDLLYGVIGANATRLRDMGDGTFALVVSLAADPTIDIGEISLLGNANLATAQVSVDTTAGGKLIVAARTGRNAITVTNHGATDIYLGPSGVTTATGTLLPGIKGASVTLPFAGALYGIVASGSQTVSCAETY